MEKSKEFELLAEALKVLHPNYHGFLEELMSKIYPIWAEQQDKTKTHFINLIGFESKDDAEQILFDVLKAMVWLEGDFYKLEIESVYCSEASVIIHMMVLHSGFAKATYFPNAYYWLRNNVSQEKGRERLKKELGDWFKNRDSIQVELDGKTYTSISSGNVVINWFGLSFFGNESISDNIFELKEFGLENGNWHSFMEEYIHLPFHKDQLLNFFLKDFTKPNEVVDPNDCIFFLKDKENLIDFRNSMIEVRARFEEMASRECGIPVQCMDYLDVAFFDTWIPDLRSVEGFKDSYWDFLMTGFDFLLRTRRDFDSNLERIKVQHEVFWKLTLYWERVDKSWTCKEAILIVHEFDLPLFPKKMENE